MMDDDDVGTGDGAKLRCYVHFSFYFVVDDRQL